MAKRAVIVPFHNIHVDIIDIKNQYNWEMCAFVSLYTQPYMSGTVMFSPDILREFSHFMAIVATYFAFSIFCLFLSLFKLM